MYCTALGSEVRQIPIIFNLICIRFLLMDWMAPIDRPRSELNLAINNQPLPSSPRPTSGLDIKMKQNLDLHLPSDMWHVTCGLTHLWCPLAALPAICSVSVRGGLWPSAPLHSDFWVWTQPAWSSRRQHAVSRSWTQAEFNKVGKCRELPLWQKAGHSLWLIDRTEIRIVVVFFCVNSFCGYWVACMVWWCPYLIPIILYLSVYRLVPPHTWPVLGTQVNQIKLKMGNIYISLNISQLSFVKYKKSNKPWKILLLKYKGCWLGINWGH